MKASSTQSGSTQSGKGAKVLQIAKLSALFVITIALVKLAFFPSNNEQPLEPQGNFAQPTISLAPNTINSSTKLAATVLRNAPTPIRATASGEVVAIFTANGTAVNSGESLVQVKKTAAPAISAAPSSQGSSQGSSGTDSDSDGGANAGAEQPTYTYHNIVAKDYGTANLNIVVGQSIEPGMEIGSITPNAFHAIAQVKASQLYTLGDNLNNGSLSINDGPPPFLCDEVRILSGPQSGASAPAASSSMMGDFSFGGGSDSPASTGGGPQVKCTIPSNQTVYEGLTATLDLGGESTGEVMTLPVTAVQGRFKEGFVFKPAADGTGKPQKVKVELGAHDGINIEIKSGLKEDDQVLQFAPADAPADPAAAGAAGAANK